MAKTQWGNVYFKDIYAGKLQQEPGGRYLFAYDNSYLEAGHPPIAYTLPLRKESFISEYGLHPFFDNLIAEGWFRNAQARALGVDPNNRFALLLGFGYDLIGTISVIDPDPQEHKSLDHIDEVTTAALLGRASLSGVQRKALLIKEGNKYRPVRPDELSTHIAKFSSNNLPHIIELEFLTTMAAQALLPNDEVVEMEIAYIPAVKEEALIVTRFDRTSLGKRLYHFEEFNQLFNRRPEDKYEGAYEDMGKFIRETPGCMPVEADKLFQRILTSLLVGNTDAHFKNFAMFHTRDGLRLTPAYDLVAASIYPEYQSIALSIAGIKDLPIGSLFAKHLLRLGDGFGLNDKAIMNAIENIGKRLFDALEIVSKSDAGTKKLRNQLIEKMEKRWNGSFKLIGNFLSKKQNKDVKVKNSRKND